ncbi:HD domain-containing protein, partial [Streptomyces niveiscabiei]|uniref:HD domain-containing protein n=1 Tax=Streptomyces niveiscabiei TaxID=164115 RepID=UPI001982248C
MRCVGCGCQWAVVGSSVVGAVARGQEFSVMGKAFVEVDESLWGKSRGLDTAFPVYPLVRHLLDAAAMALFLWDR